MPTYDFVNTQTGESFTQMMRIAEKEQFLEANPHIQQQIGAPATISGGNFQRKMDGGWKENMRILHLQKKWVEDPLPNPRFHKQQRNMVLEKEDTTI